jgi:DNA polymerase-3 subunit gamma/tau
VGVPDSETPAQIKQRMEGERQQQAVDAISNDPNVQGIVERFGAKVKPDSIRPREQSDG